MKAVQFGSCLQALVIKTKTYLTPGSHTIFEWFPRCLGPCFGSQRFAHVETRAEVLASICNRFLTACGTGRDK